MTDISRFIGDLATRWINKYLPDDELFGVKVRLTSKTYIVDCNSSTKHLRILLKLSSNIKLKILHAKIIKFRKLPLNFRYGRN